VKFMSSLAWLWRRRPAPLPMPEPDPAPDLAPDLTLVGTADLFEELSRRHAAAVLIAIRELGGDRIGHQVMVLQKGVRDMPSLLRRTAEIVDDGEPFRDVQEGDL